MPPHATLAAPPPCLIGARDTGDVKVPDFEDDKSAELANGVGQEPNNTIPKRKSSGPGIPVDTSRLERRSLSNRDAIMAEKRKSDRSSSSLSLEPSFANNKGRASLRLSEAARQNMQHAAGPETVGSTGGVAAFQSPSTGSSFHSKRTVSSIPGEGELMPLRGALAKSGTNSSLKDDSSKANGQPVRLKPRRTVSLMIDAEDGKRQEKLATSDGQHKLTEAPSSSLTSLSEEAKDSDDIKSQKSVYSRLKEEAKEPQNMSWQDEAKTKLRRSRINYRTSMVTTQELFSAFKGKPQVVNSINTSAQDHAKSPTNDTRHLDWLLALSFPNPEFVSAKHGVSEQTARYSYATCFRGEEYETKRGFSNQAAASVEEQNCFINAFEALPEASDGTGKAMGQRHFSGTAPPPPSPTSPERKDHWEVASHPSSDGDETAYASSNPRDFAEGNRDPPSCFLSLVRNVILSKLVLHCGLFVRSVLSEDESQIVLLVTCTPHELLREADRQSFATELSIRATDPASLEPCTKTFYPLLHWYFRHKVEDKCQELEEVLHDTCKAMRERLCQQTGKVRALYSRTLDLWEGVCRTVPPRPDDWECESAGRLVNGMSFASSSFHSTKSFHSLAVLQEDFSSRVHIGNKSTQEKVSQAFERYMRLKTCEPLAAPRSQIGQVNKEYGRRLLRDYYEHLNVEIIPPFSNFEVAQYLGNGGVDGTPWVWSHFNMPLMALPGKEVALPFRSHQVIKLLTSIINRQIDVERLIDLGYVNSMFPLDTEEKYEAMPEYAQAEMVFGEDTGAENDEPGALFPYFASEKTDEYSELFTAWGFPDPSLPFCSRAYIVFRQAFHPPKVQLIKNYYGEEIALYFALTRHLCWWCIAPGGIGLVAGIVQLLSPRAATSDAKAILHMVHGLAVPIWGALCLAAWKRQEATYAAKWGLIGQERASAVRPSFRGLPRRSPVDFTNDLDMFQVSCCQYGRLGAIPRQICSWIMMTFVIGAHVAATLGILNIRKQWIEQRTLPYPDHSPRLFAAVLIAIQMTCFNGLGYWLCPLLTKWESHPRCDAYARHLISKQCVLEFINQFSIFFYIYFLKGSFEGCYKVDQRTGRHVLQPPSKVDGSQLCLEELQDSVILVLLAIASLNILEIVVPAWILPLLRRGTQKFRKRSRSLVCAAEVRQGQNFTLPRKLVQSMLDKELYSSVEAGGTYGDYMEITVLFAHLSFFSVAAPFAPIVVMILLIIEIRIDGHKLFHVLRRPLPTSAESIGIWHDILQFVTWVAVVTNSTIVAWSLNVFTAPMFSKKEQFSLDVSTRWIHSMGCMLGLAAVKVFIFVAIPKVPTSLAVLREHHDWVRRKIDAHDMSLLPRNTKLKDLDFTIYRNEK